MADLTPAQKALIGEFCLQTAAFMIAMNRIASRDEFKKLDRAMWAVIDVLEEIAPDMPKFRSLPKLPEPKSSEAEVPPGVANKNSPWRT